MKNKKQNITHSQAGLLGAESVAYKIEQTVHTRVTAKIWEKVAIPINNKPLGFTLWTNIRTDLRDLNK